ncbi:hypothetical protein [Streptomyces sp. MP131-18]|uniref:hypothetical protein n=1 Tax=Streptomyces sp. MP131-18 TaxID=1857892 RepID=UPI0009CBB2CE|nr:hypothetical protein [Streptomyces sp. MP131-18]ONK09546.1 hypothetical protein STBA_02460 [Streptomyces sp. MP131-18]
MTYDQRRSAAVVRLAEAVGPEWLDECVAITATVRATANRSATLAGLSPHLRGQSVRRAVAMARVLEVPCPRAIALAALSARLPQDERLALAREAVDACARDDDGVRRGRALVLMAGHLPDDLLSRAVQLARRTPDPLIAIRALSALARRLPDADAHAAVAEARARQGDIASVSHAVRARFALAEFAPPEERGPLLMELALVTPQVRYSLLAEARPWVEKSRADLPSAVYRDLMAMPPMDSEELAVALPEKVRAVLHSTLGEAEDDDRIAALLFRAHMLIADGCEESSHSVQRLLRHARRLTPPGRAAVLTALAACHCGEALNVLLSEALECAQVIDDVRPRASALSDAMVDASEPVLADLEGDLVFRPGRLGDMEVLSFLRRSGVPLADGTVEAATARMSQFADEGARRQAFTTCVQRASQQYCALLGRYALTEIVNEPQPMRRATDLQRLAQLPLPPELRQHVEDEQRRTLGPIDPEEQLAILGGIGAAPGMLSTAMDKEQLIRECAIPLLRRISMANSPHHGWLMSPFSIPSVEALFDAFPHRLTEDLVRLLWVTAEQTQPWLRPWLLVRLVSRLPAQYVADAVDWMRASENQPDSDPGRFRHLLADEVTRVFPILAPKTRSLLLNDALGRNPTPSRLQAVMPLVGADEVEDVLRRVQELPFPSCVAAAETVRRHIDAQRFASFLKPLTDTALAGGPGVGPGPVIDLARLVNDQDRDRLLHAAAVALAHRSQSERRKALHRLPTRDRSRIVQFLLQRKALEPEELPPLIGDLPPEFLGDAEQVVVEIKSARHRLTALGALITAAAPHFSPDRLWEEVLRTARADPATGHATDGLLDLLRKDLPPLPPPRMSQLGSLIAAVDDPEKRILLLCALARHTEALRRGVLLKSALDTAETITQDKRRAAALFPVVRSAADSPEAVARTLDAITRIRLPEGRQGLLREHLPALREGIASGTVDVSFVDRAIRTLSRIPRPLVVRDLALLSTAAAPSLPESAAVPRSFLKAMHTVGDWWK